MSKVLRPRSKLLALEILLIALVILFLLPFYIVFSNSFKSMSDILLDSMGLPPFLDFNNYIRAWEKLNFTLVLKNTLIITAVSNLFLLVFASMAAYRIARSDNRFTRGIFSLFVASMVIPFQAIMIPLVKVLNTAGIVNTLTGVIVSYVGLGVSMTLFLYHGFVKSVPREIEEAATVDGCNPYGVFWRIVFPLLKPMTVTTLMLNTLWIWNDFMLPLIILQKTSLHTIQLAINSLFGEYLKQWDMALAALVMGIAPMIIFFLFLQRYVIEGISAGAVKG
ncbi:carbohydrate ABC transporter permease [Paenibacillus sp. S150]|uniref:carbohydrate ABC transporter permease n=1 Tax=Paenibacillus sp. S150 TaxID=2749826 RepID=UPI001C56F2D8|nr:carbohydrate ABC transporter permease [Paenibacillus sp. S150]MBW4079816.1 carbohydrate ABC transporter permease [Paenibacillus sp. S150]